MLLRKRKKELACLFTMSTLIWWRLILLSLFASVRFLSLKSKIFTWLQLFLQCCCSFYRTLNLLDMPLMLEIDTLGRGEVKHAPFLLYIKLLFYSWNQMKSFPERWLMYFFTVATLVVDIEYMFLFLSYELQKKIKEL